MNDQTVYKTLVRKGQALAFSLLFGGILATGVPAIADANVTPEPESTQSTLATEQDLKEKWGIELTAMRITAAGHMVDFRYRVLDADKAAPLFKRQIKPYLIHQESGKVLAVPNTAKVGSLRNSNTPQNDRVYWMFFGNHQRLVQKGDKVTVAIGDFRATNIEVE